MPFPPSVVAALGLERAQAAERAASTIRRLSKSAPDHTSWVMHVPLPLQATSWNEAQRELADLLRQRCTGGPLFAATLAGPDGKMSGWVSELSWLPEREAPKLFMLDLLSRLGAWWLSHLWRSADLVDVAESCLSQWQVLPAAACARALLEGTAALVVEGGQLFADWAEFKRTSPTLDNVMVFRHRFGERLHQAQLASRIGERSGGRAPSIKRTNVMTFLEKLEKRVGPRLWDVYEWLCDAVHPSFGFGTVYVAAQGVHESGGTFAADVRRRSHEAETGEQRITPTVARAVADAMDIASQQLLVELPRLRWLIDDIGLTAEVASLMPSKVLGALPRRPSRLEPCPCGSGRKFGKCVHKWGMPAEPPVRGQNASRA